MTNLNEVYRAYETLEFESTYRKPDWSNSLSITPVPGDILTCFVNEKYINIYYSANGKYYLMSMFYKLATPTDFITRINTPRSSQNWIIELDCTVYSVPQHVPCRVLARLSTFDQLLVEGYLRSGKSLPPDRVGSQLAPIDIRKQFKQQEHMRVAKINKIFGKK
jgi:hypothetical protein